MHVRVPKTIVRVKIRYSRDDNTIGKNDSDDDKGKRKKKEGRGNGERKGRKDTTLGS